jgi:hypothetical protein
MPIAVESASYPVSAASAVQPLLREMPKLLEYRAEADADAEFIPKTIAGFAGGFMLCGAALVIGAMLLKSVYDPHLDVARQIAIYLAFLIGIDGVASSLLLVGLKVRADHAATDLFARHWLNSIGTGALHVFLIAGPWVLMDPSIGLNVRINRFVASAIWMALMAYPAVAARWTVGPAVQHTKPGA